MRSMKTDAVGKYVLQGLMLVCIINADSNTESQTKELNANLSVFPKSSTATTSSSSATTTKTTTTTIATTTTTTIATTTTTTGATTTTITTQEPETTIRSSVAPKSKCDMSSETMKSKNIDQDRSRSCLNTESGNDCVVYCEKNFSILKKIQKKMTCRDGNWTTEVPRCKQIKCKKLQPLDVKNLNGTCDSVAVGENCTIPCKRNHISPKNDASITATCKVGATGLSASWKGVRKCTEIKCQELQPLPTQNLSGNCNSLAVGENCTIPCKRNHISPNNDDSITATCRLDSTKLSASWRGIQNCTKIKCHELHPLSARNLNGTCDSLAIGEKCIIPCKRNHISSKNDASITVTCRVNSTKLSASWKGIRNCTKIQCESMKTRNYRSGCEGKFIGDSCSIQCKKGFKFPSNTTREARKCILSDTNSGEWSPAIENCQEIKCEKFSVNTNQTPSDCAENSINGSCEVTCVSKYKFSGTSEVKQRSFCSLSLDELSASWSSVPDCEKIACGELQRMDKYNLNGTCGPLTVDETCTLPCKLHHKLPTGEMNVTITCSQDGDQLRASYEGIKKCIKIQCADIKPGHYTHECQKKFIGDSCSVQCKQGFKFPSNTTTMSTDCVIDGTTGGQWSPAIGNCQKVVCQSTSRKDFGNPSEHKEHRLTPENNCKTGTTCTVNCPEGYQFSTDEANRNLTCDIMSENWRPSPQSIGLCKPTVHTVRKCQYWFSGIRKNETEARLACINVLDKTATLAMPKTLKPLEKFLIRNFYLVGGSLRKDGYRWDDGTKMNDVLSANGGKYVRISKKSGKLTAIRPKQEHFFVCEKSIRGHNPCSSNKPCGSLGKCVSYGCSYRCECQDLVYGPRCEHGPVSVNITDLKTKSFRVSVRNNADNESALFKVFMNGRPLKNYTLEPKIEWNETVQIPVIKFNTYISVKASLIGRPNATTSICRRIKPNQGINLSEITNDDCNGTVLDIFWKGFWEESDDTMPYKVYLNGTSHGLSQAGKKLRIQGLDIGKQYKIKVVPEIVGCSYDDYPTLFESEMKRTSRGPPGKATLNMSDTAGGNCSIVWKLGRWWEVKMFKINITESVRFKPKDTNLSSNVRVIQVNTSKDYTFKTNPNSLYRVSVGTVPEQKCTNVKIKWSNLAIGCRTNVGAPKPITKSPEISEVGNRMTIKLQAVDERNGEASCYFVIIHKANTSLNTSEVVMDTSRLKQVNETVMVGDYYVASAMKRFTGEITVALGDGKFSCCNIKNGSKACDLDSKARERRATTTDVVTASNNPLEPGTTYKHYILITAPRGDGLEPFLTTSPLSEPWVIPEDPEGVLGTNFAAIILPVIIGIILVIIILGVLIYRRRNEKSIPRNGVGARLDPTDNHSLSIEPHAYVELSENPESIISRELAQFSMQLPRLYQIMNEKRENEDTQFLEEFKKDITNALRKCTLTRDIAQLRMNQPKNRYKNIIPYDRARVVLGSISGVEFSDYINASYIDGYSHPRKFIAAQGPKPETTGDFWRMVLEQDCRVIAMLTRTKEKHKVKCAQYWPMEDGKTENYGNIAVQLLATISYGEFIKSELQVSRGSEFIQVSHFQFIAWPDHGIPITTSSILRFHQYVTSEQPDASGPIVVHCSAGVGRTGTLIALDHLRNEIVHTDEINIATIIGKMRTKRPEMVQTLEQYIFIHKLVLELYQFGYTDLNVSNFNSSYTELKRGNADGRSFEEEFAMLDYFLPLNTNQFSAEKEQNKHLNRYPAILPYDHNAVFIQMNASDKSVPYYNASFVASYSPGNQFIAAQNPDETSFELFWRVVLDNSVNTIVGLFEEGESDHYCYWPHKTTESNYDSVNVRIKSTQQESALTERTLEVSCNGKEIEVKHLVYNAWPEQSTPSSSSTVLDIISKIEKHHQTLVKSESKNTLVHCSDGAGRTGTFCAISNLIERLKSENSVDVFRTVKDLRDQRPMMVHTLAQYQFCYQSISEFLQLFDLYGNFQ